MQKRWLPEYEVSVSLASALIAQQFPQLEPLQLKLLGQGWDNTAFLVNTDYVFRFPRRQCAVELLQNEITLLPWLQQYGLPLQIPCPQFIGKPALDYPWPFAGYRKLQGKVGSEINFSLSERMQSAKPLAQFLAKLHAADISILKNMGVATDTIGRLDLNKRLPGIHENLTLLTQQRLFDSMKLMHYVEQLNVFSPSSVICLTQGDLYAKHLIFNERHEIIGVIDWGDAELGHPAIDLAIAHSFLPIQAHGDFREHYGEISDETWELARIRAIYSCSMQAVYAHDINDEPLLCEALNGLSAISQAL